MPESRIGGFSEERSSGSSLVRGRSVIRREAMVMNESVDRQDVKALSNNQGSRDVMLSFPITSLLYMDMCGHALKHLRLNLTHGSFCLGLFQMHKTPVNLDYLPFFYSIVKGRLWE